MKNPCNKDCPKRTMHCHATCREYAIFYAERRKENNERLELNKSLTAMYANRNKEYIKMQKRGRGYGKQNEGVKK